jgi:hypothetical protein
MIFLKRVAIIAFTAGLLPGAGLAADVCPSPPSQVDSRLATDAQMSIGSLGKLVAADVAVKVTPVTRNLFEKYPSADKLVVAQLIMANSCQMLLQSGLKGAELVSANERVNAQVLSLMIEQQQKDKENKPRTHWESSDGILKLVNSGGQIKNLTYENYVFIRTDLRWENDGSSYSLGGGYGSRLPGVIIEVNPSAAVIVAYPIGSQRKAFEAAIKSVIDRIAPGSATDKLSRLQNCLKIEYDDLYGGHYTDYLVNNIVATGGGHAWGEKSNFDECKQEYEKSIEYKTAYLHGGGYGTFEFWSGNDEVQLSNVMLRDVTEQIERHILSAAKRPPRSQ